MLVVKKFGGSSVANSERILNVARRCIEEYVKGNDVVVVLSAMGDTTDDLLDLAAQITDKPSRRELDMLLSTGEQVSVALTAMAVARMGVPVVSLNAFQVQMHTSSDYGNAKLKKIDTKRIKYELENRKIVFITG
ncbi:MAG: aspartate kinase, partial [Lachnospiraceae bacterium]|nr:aspartate kinase [Lachnospiraceae bacterium]